MRRKGRKQTNKQKSAYLQASFTFPNSVLPFGSTERNSEKIKAIRAETYIGFWLLGKLMTMKHKQCVWRGRGGTQVAKLKSLWREPDS